MLKRRKTNALLVPILILFGINMIVATTNAIQWIAEGNFRDWSQGSVSLLVEQIEPEVETALAALPADAGPEQIKTTLDAVLLDGPLVAYELYDRNGMGRIFSAVPAHTTDLNRLPGVGSDLQASDGTAGSPARMPKGTIQQIRTAELALPGDGTVSGSLRLFIDQTNAVSLFYAAHKDVGYISAWFLAVALMIVIYVVWSRLREQWAADRELRHLAHHDGLTNLPKREYFIDKLNYLLSRNDPEDQLTALLFLDLDKFKQINDTMGHATGDALLCEFARRLRDNTRKSDLLCRLGGDEFAVALVGLKSPERMVPFANRLCRILAEPYEVNGREFVTSASIGVAIAPNDANDAEGLFKCADLALYRSKAEGGSLVCFFEDSMDVAFQQRMQLEHELKSAIDDDQLNLFYQPQYDLRTGQLTAHEALLRWFHPKRGLVQPDEFIAIAEENGFIMPLNQWVLERACTEALTWDSDQSLAVNLSASQFKTGSAADLVLEVLGQTGLPANRLEIEITEAMLLADLPKVREQLHRLKESGVRIAMDDFGTGHSSLSCLAGFPFDKIKIDRSLIAELPSNPTADTIVRTVVALGHELGMSITAEGVETSEQERILQTHGCDIGQGFLYGRPAPRVASADQIETDNAIVYPAFASTVASPVTNLGRRSEDAASAGQVRRS